MWGKKVVEIKSDSLEYATLEGIRFIGTHIFESLSNGDSVYYYIDFSEVTKRVEVNSFHISTDGQCMVYTYANPVISSKGTLININNANSQSKTKNQLKIYYSPAITAKGSIIAETYVALGDRGSRVMSDVFTYRIIGGDMLVEIKNVSGTSMAYGSVIFNWKES